MSSRREILSMYFYISLGVVRSLPWGSCGLAVRRLPRMQEVVGSNLTEATKICFSHFTQLEWNVKNCFVKLIQFRTVTIELVTLAKFGVFTPITCHSSPCVGDRLTPPTDSDTAYKYNTIKISNKCRIRVNTQTYSYSVHLRRIKYEIPKKIRWHVWKSTLFLVRTYTRKCTST